MENLNMKKITGFNYFISNEGIVTNSKGRVIKPEDNGLGYMYVNLCKDGKITHVSVHRLVATEFCYNDNPEINEVLHIDGNKKNNCSENLIWATHKENMQDELTRKNISRANKGRTFSEEHKKRFSKARKGKGTKKVRCIELDRVFSSISQAEKELGIYGTNICKVCNGKRAKAGGYSWEYCK